MNFLVNCLFLREATTKNIYINFFLWECHQGLNFPTSLKLPQNFAVIKSLIKVHFSFPPFLIPIAIKTFFCSFPYTNERKRLIVEGRGRIKSARNSVFSCCCSLILADSLENRGWPRKVAVESHQ